MGSYRARSFVGVLRICATKENHFRMKKRFLYLSFIIHWVIAVVRVLSILTGLVLIANAQSLKAKGQPFADVASLSKVLDAATTFAYYPSLKKLEVNISHLPGGTIDNTLFATAEIWSRGDKGILTKQSFSFTNLGGRVLMDVPDLEDGTYTLRVRMNDAPVEVKRTFMHKNFEWLGNKLGITDKVYPPFTPITVNGKDVGVVLRNYRMNGFGLWDNIKSEGKEILNGPILLHLATENGESTWSFGSGKWISQTQARVVYQAEAECPSVRVKTISTIDYDGAMKVEMELSPGNSPEPIKRLWLEIPIKDEEAPLFHYSIAPGIRRNYSGATPRGGKITWINHPDDIHTPPNYSRGGTNAPVWKAEPGSDDGVVWTNRDMRPWEHVWKTDFVPYIWLGGGTRGIAWFGASPRDYKVDSRGIMQRIERERSTLKLMVDLINWEGVLERTRKIVFGLQASPTKPMPDDWRSNVAIPGIDIGVHCAPWGAHACPDKYPDDKNFTLVDELIKVRQTGMLNDDIFVKLEEARSPHFKSMGHFGSATWLDWVRAIAKVNQAFALEAGDADHGLVEGALYVPYRYHVDGSKHDVNYVWKEASKERLYPERVAKKIKNAPLAMYFEEHASTIVNEEWVVFQDEWRGRRVHKDRDEYVAEPTRATNNFAVGRQGFPPSYRDFALWYANEWMKRGVSIYCDNVYLHVQDNPLTSEAFIDDEGDLQPAARIWDLREYHKRMWQLAQEWNTKKPPFPITIVHHMTNSLMLPVHTWAESLLDIEYPFRATEPDPFSPEYILAQAGGRQTGCYRHWLESGQRLRENVFAESVAEMNPDHIRTEWGMRMVHEVMRWLFPHENYASFEPARTLEKALWDFGYGTDGCKVVNYWSNDIPISVSDPDAKWLLMQRRKDKTLFLVLQSYQKEAMPLELTINSAKVGFLPSAKARNVETNEAVNAIRTGQSLQLNTTITKPYGTMVLVIGSGSR
jgi:hypothetical protein